MIRREKYYVNHSQNLWIRTAHFDFGKPIKENTHIVEYKKDKGGQVWAYFRHMSTIKEGDQLLKDARWTRHKAMVSY